MRYSLRSQLPPNGEYHIINIHFAVAPYVDFDPTTDRVL